MDLIEPGVYWGLPEDDYHADPALGSTDIKLLHQDPMDYWWQSFMNPLRPEREKSPALIYGTALHTLMFHGQEVFDAEYARALEKADYANLLVTTDDLKAKLRELEEPLGGSKQALIERVQKHVPDAQIWDKLLADHQAAHEDCEMLPRDIYDRIMICNSILQKNPHYAPAFKGGVPEVSIFTERAGVRVKARIDYMKIYAGVDLKSVEVRPGWSMKEDCKQTIFRRGYDIQAAHYLYCMDRARELIASGHHVAYDMPKPKKEWLDAFVQQEEKTFVFVFYRKSGPAWPYIIEWDRHADYHERADDQVGSAIYSYQEYMDRFGTDFWVKIEKTDIMADEEVPLWHGR